MSLSWQKVLEYSLLTIASMWALIAPIQGLFLALGVIIAIDMFLGVWRAVKQGHAVRPSQAIRRTIGKSTAYMVAVIAGFALDYIAGDLDKMIAARGFALAIGIAECASLAENFLKITGIDLRQVLQNVFKPGNSPKDAPPTEKDDAGNP